MWIGKRQAVRLLQLAALLAVSAAFPAGAEGVRELNGFRLEPAAIPVPDILPGGPPRDGIPALFEPEALPAAEAPWEDDQPVIGFSHGGEARAYPLAVLNWHELVNDRVGGLEILVSYCPLCGTGIVFEREARRFGVSGLLYQSDMLLYDHETESLWSQIAAAAVTGPELGKRLRILRSELTRWEEWRRSHPETTVLSANTGHLRDYTRDPYEGYEKSRQLYFRVPLDRRYHPKLRTAGLRLLDGTARG